MAADGGFDDTEETRTLLHRLAELDAEVRLYDYLFNKPDPSEVPAGQTFLVNAECDGIPVSCIVPTPMPHRHIGLGIYDAVSDLGDLSTLPHMAELPRDDRIDIVELAAWLRGQLLCCLVLGIFYASGLSLIGLELGLMIGLISGFRWGP